MTAAPDLRWCSLCDHPFLGAEARCQECRSGWLTPKAALRMRKRDAAYALRRAR